MVASAILLIAASPRVGSSGGSWLSGWSYRMAHTIVGSTAGAQTNYPIPITVHYDNGYSTGSDVYSARFHSISAVISALSSE